MKRILTAMLALLMMVGLLLPVHAAPDRASQILSGMSLRDKITQMLMVDFRYWDEDPADSVERRGFTVMNDQVRRIMEDYHFGAVIYFAQNLAGTQQSYELTMAMQEAAVKGGGIPMLISADQEGGSVYRLSTGTALPGNMALGAAGDPEYARMTGRIIGSELSALGINTALAPVVDVNSNANNPVIGLRSYSDDPELVGLLAGASIAGMAEYNIIGCAKHFPGHGDTTTDSHYGLPVVDKPLEELLACELIPFDRAIGQGVEMIMTAHILYPQIETDTLVSNKTGKAEALPATMSDDIITGLLKERLGFAGIVVTDAMNMAGIADNWTPVQSIVTAIQAGADMICMPCTLYDMTDLADLDYIIAGVEAAVENGTIPMSRIDDAVTRILTVKEHRGILDWSAGNHSLETAKTVVGGAENRSAERELAAAAVTVVQNHNSTLPLTVTGESKVLMMAPYDNERAQMVMGWNRAAEAGLIPEGAQVKVVTFGKNTTLDTYRAELDWADTVILNSEVGSAGAMNGGSWTSAYPIAVVDYAERLGKTTVVQSVDKPYDVQCYGNADAVLAVYGCKGSSVDPTEALVGGVTRDEKAYGPNIIAGIEVILGTFGAQGTLPVDIPRLENGEFTHELVYARGHGLTYDSLLAAEEPVEEPEPAPDIPPAEVPAETPEPPAAEEPAPVEKQDGGLPLPGLLIAAGVCTAVIAAVALKR